MEIEQSAIVGTTMASEDSVPNGDKSFKTWWDLTGRQRLGLAIGNAPRGKVGLLGIQVLGGKYVGMPKVSGKDFSDDIRSRLRSSLAFVHDVCTD